MSLFIETQLFTYLVEERLISQEDDVFDVKVNRFLSKYEQRLGILFM